MRMYFSGKNYSYSHLFRKNSVKFVLLLFCAECDSPKSAQIEPSSLRTVK